MFSHPLAWLLGTILMGGGMVGQDDFWGGSFQFLNGFVILWLSWKGSGTRWCLQPRHFRGWPGGDCGPLNPKGSDRGLQALSWLKTFFVQMTVYIWKLRLTLFPPGPLQTLHASVVAPACGSRSPLENTTFPFQFNSCRL